MKKKLLKSMRVLLVAVLLGVGVNGAWAGVSTYDFQNYCKGLATKNTIGLTLGSSPGKVNNTAVYTISDVSDGTYGDFAFDSKFAAQTTDITFRRGGGTQGSADGYAGLQNTNNARYFAVLNLAVGDQIVFTTTDGGNGGLKFVTTNVTYDNSGTPTAPAQWDVVTNGTTYTVTAAGTLGLQLQKLGYINCITITSSSETVSAPTISVTGANGTSRTVSITGGTSDEANTVKTYYTTDGSNPSASSTEYSVPFVLSDASYTVKAVSISSTTVASDITSLVVDASTPLSLKVPDITLISFVANGGVFNPTYSFTSDQSSVIGAPAATLTYSFNGGAATAGTSYTPTATGTLRVTASAEGYASTYRDLNITCAEFLKTYVFDATKDISVNDGAPTTYTGYSINSTGCNLYALSNCTYTIGKSISFDSNMQFAWAITANQAYCLFARTNKSTISYSLNDGEYIEFTNFGAPVIASSATTSTQLAWYSSVRQINVYTPSNYTVSKAISAAGWATYCSPYALDFSSAIDNLDDAYIVTGGADGVLSKTSVKGSTVPANTGLLLKGEGACTIPVAASSSTDVSTNKLVGKTAEFALAANDGYVLMNDATNGLAFYKNTNAFTVGANTAYLPADFTASARGFFLLDGSDATGIGTALMNKEAMNSEVYNLQGQRVAAPTKGLYIVNGKKAIVK